MAWILEESITARIGVVTLFSNNIRKRRHGTPSHIAIGIIEQWNQD